MKYAWSEYKPYMLPRFLEIGGRGWDWVLWDLIKSNAAGYPHREAVVDTFYGMEQEKRRRKTWQEVSKEVDTIILNLYNLGISKESMIISQLPNGIENWELPYVASKLMSFYHYAQIELGEAEVKNVLAFLDPDITIIIPEYHGREIARWHLEHQKSHPRLKCIFVVTKPGELVPEGTRPFTDLVNPEIWNKYDERFFNHLKTDANEPLYIPPTGGTTGVPKTVAWTTRNFHAANDWGERGTVCLYDNVLVFGPMNGGTGRPASLLPSFRAAKVILLSEFNEEDACKLCEQEKVTVWAGIPVTQVRTFESPYFEQYNTKFLRVMICGGAPVPIEVGKKVVERNIMLINMYGSVEAGFSTASIGPLSTKEEQIYTCGPSCLGWDFFVADPQGNRLPPGELGEVLCWSLHHGYYNNPEMNKEAYDENDIVHSGDIGIMDDKGNIRIVGRTKDMILRGGQNIFPKEIEDLLMKHPKVKDVAIVGMPDKDLGEKACAYIVPVPGEKVALEEITAFLDEHKITKYKWPERIELIDQLPTSTGGKVHKTALKEDITEKLKKEGKI